MDNLKIKKMLSTDYAITLNGGTLGYILAVMAAEQGRLEVSAKSDNATEMEIMSAQANNIVGNTLLDEIYKAAGPDFLAFAMGVDVDTMKRVMEAKDGAELADMIIKKRQQEKARKMH